MAGRLISWILAVLSLVFAGGVFAQSTNLKAYRFGSTYYVVASDVANYYRLGSDSLDAVTRAKYNTSFAQLELEADSREIFVNGVDHWLSSPILATRDKLWIAELDLLKTLSPVLNPEQFRKRGVSIRTVVIDPGHGGADRGTRGRNSFEKVMTLDTAMRVQRLLAASGVRVVMTRTSDMTVPLDERVMLAKGKGADLFVSIHFNSGGSAEGIETYCMPPAGTSSTADPRADGGNTEAEFSNRFDDQNVWLAHCVQKSALGATGAMDRGVRRARFYVLRYSVCPSILIEGGFLSSASEEGRILRSDYRDKLAKGIADGILAYKKTVEMSPDSPPRGSK